MSKQIKYVSYAVIGFHFALLALLAWVGEQQSSLFKKKPIINFSEKQVYLASSQNAPATKEISSAPKTFSTPPKPESVEKKVEQSSIKVKASTTPQKKTAITETKINEKKPPIQKQEVAKPKVGPSQEESKSSLIKKNLVAKAKESLAKIPPTTSTMAQETTEPTSKMPSLGSLKVKQDAETAGDVQSYEGELIASLQRQLTLPEQGKVTVELTVNKNGRIKNVVVIKAESERNRRYLEKALPTATVAPFTAAFSAAEDYVFHIILSHTL